MPKSPGIPSPHGSLCRNILSDPGFAQVLMQTCLPAEVVRLFPRPTGTENIRLLFNWARQVLNTRPILSC